MAKLRMDSYGVWVHKREPRKPKLGRPMRPQEAAAKNKRDAVRRAYFLIRDEPAKHETVLRFARALGGKIDITEEMLTEAFQIELDHCGAVLQ